ncbi:MAG: hypothetical protein H8D23_10875 [Candidatus Brocadiales bacterium]|nr:hypothetical protein [Candidatus Brocadiales bacterium]
MNISQLRWDLMHHKNADEGICQGNLRPTGCLVCDHDVEACSIENCELCAKKQGTYSQTDFNAPKE